MKRIPQAIYLTPDEIDERIKQLENDAMRLGPTTEKHRAILHEISRLRVYSEAKRWLSRPASKHAAKRLEANLASDEQAIKIAEAIATKLNRKVVVRDGRRKEIWTAEPDRKLDS